MRFRREDQLPLAEHRLMRKKVSVFVHRADYRGAVRAAERLRRLHPGDLGLAAHHASLLGDYAEQFPPRKRRMLQSKSIRTMRDLLRRTACRPDPIIIGILKNEFYWQTKQRRKQYALGVAEAKLGWRGGYYSQGVGAAWHALELAQRGRLAAARRWADRAVTAWRRYEKAVPDYYNQFVHRALAEGVRGNTEEMERCLGRGAKLAHKPLDYREFTEVRMFVAALRPRARPREVAVRPFTPRDVSAFADYIFRSPLAFRRGLGLRPTRRGQEAGFRARWAEWLRKPRAERGKPKSLAIVYQGRRVGAHTLTDLLAGNSAVMHAHIFSPRDRGLGIGRLSYVLAMRRFMRDHRLKEIRFQSPLHNPAPLRVKEALGLRPRGLGVIESPVVRPGLKVRLYRADRKAVEAAARRVGL